ncbi:transmembrane amino acid transporter protein-domain-containing protein [Yarrowia lipolytica]|uniref:YALI0C12100p n=2 Tax=Yarrowia lipolytica TaxID=4952 RepID=Q6CC65_YARLI|nr:YALI0C12100p [Yarrowia lipolytica CLIB122]RDW27920.1 transmembrane amino acid transporter protein-domain-containing protein [Yarrowia lipolytica]RDW38066.1 transmembrane amino acid transporter protein-domain-containing protein [Yarrowia lipolytica]RDW47866.1 transmembrane amino acid transporter protein-domain-containing protein [Yarrowia lipolytica]RDW55027.1 transmembrane amino acid transporter protein-domain-containing protein [Yarrowia lipolytica]CAG82057.1 YALI0C12100p [Yarrowia lipolyt|eukprot:XP_501747.1 YALI0C12100p [Yarrowia lipolytica CLIB122]
MGVFSRFKKEKPEAGAADGSDPAPAYEGHEEHHHHDHPHLDAANEPIMIIEEADSDQLNYHAPREAYYYYAAIQRRREDTLPPDQITLIPGFARFFKKKEPEVVNSEPVIVSEQASEEAALEKQDYPDDYRGDHTHNHDHEKEGVLEGIPGAKEDMAVANKALKTASWMSVFYLITTDIMGPTGAPYSISTLGYFPGIFLFTVLAVTAAYTGWLIFKMYMKMDSPQYPMRTYGDMATRIYGPVFRLAVDLLQAIQLWCNVGVLVLSNGQALSQVAANHSEDGKSHVCFAALCIIFMGAGMLVGQIRSLKNFGFLANFAIWMNLAICFATMGLARQYGINVRGNELVYGSPLPPKKTSAVATDIPFQTQLQGLMNIVYSYGGAMMFVEFCAEMRRPRDFIKGMLTAQTVIYCCYMLFGVFVYAYQGQFVMNPANQGVPSETRYEKNWQDALNMIGVVSALIAAALYGNVGVKVVYRTVFQRVLRLPNITDSAGGRVLWTLAVFVYWAVAFVIASAIPQFSSLVSLVGAICILQFSYTLPPFLYAGLTLQEEASKEDHYDPSTNTVTRIDTWKNWSRWKRGLTGRPWWMLFNIIIFLMSLATAILGAYASVYNLVQAFDAPGGNTSSFTCKSPVAG